MPAKSAAKSAKNESRPGGRLSQRQQIIERNKDPAIAMEDTDPTPVHIPGLSDRARPLTLREEMRRFVRETVSQVADQNEEETFEEANDFDIDGMEESDLLTPYSLVHTAQEPETPAYSDLEGSPTPEDRAADAAPEPPSGGSEGEAVTPAPSPDSDAPGQQTVSST